jgi:Tfp pilus assembly protein PilN
MGQFDLNLSTRPFKAYRAKNLGLFVLLVVLVALSVYQLYSYQQYSALAAASREEEMMKRAEADKVGEQTRSLNVKMTRNNANAKLSEVALLNDLILKKSFSWTRVLATLEGLVPDDVRLVSLRPFIDEHGKIYLNMNIRGRTLADANQFLRALENSKVFTDVALAIEERKGTAASSETEFTLSAYYVAPPPVVPAPAPAPAKPAAGKSAAPAASAGGKSVVPAVPAGGKK